MCPYNGSASSWRHGGSISSLSDMGLSATRELWPKQPTCQTADATCPQCGNAVRVHLLFPSACPFCNFAFPDPAGTAEGFSHAESCGERFTSQQQEVPPMLPKSALANRVVGLTITSLLLHAVILMASAATKRERIPLSYSEFQSDCANGKLGHHFCSEVRHEFTAMCEEKHNRTSECVEQWEANLFSLGGRVRDSMLFDLVLGFCCIGSVPLCGCVGACRDSRPCVICFLIMCALDVVLHSIRLLSGDWRPLITIIFPVAGFYYARQLQLVQASPPPSPEVEDVTPPLTAPTLQAIQPQLHPQLPQHMLVAIPPGTEPGSILHVQMPSR